MPHQVSLKAQSDLDAIWYFVATESRSIETANRLIESIEQGFIVIGRHPRIGRLREDDFGGSKRSLVVGEYVIVYSVQEDGAAFILRVVHGRRDLDFLLDE